MKWLEIFVNTYLNISLKIKRFIMKDTLVLKEKSDPRGFLKKDITYAQILKDGYGNKVIQFFSEGVPYIASFNNENLSAIAECVRIYEYVSSEEGIFEFQENEESKKTRLNLSKKIK
jgi:hypothetical protein